VILKFGKRFSAFSRLFWRYQTHVNKGDSISDLKPLTSVACTPYGKWTCADGTELLFNRDYRPIWRKTKSGTVIAADPDEWVIFSKQEYFFGDHNAPGENSDSNRACTNQLCE
jgi:hypothetical protein